MGHGTLDWKFPKRGIDVSRPSHSWPVHQGPHGERHYSCADALNVRSFDPVTGRQRGGSRPGFTKYVPTAVVADFIVQQLDCLVGSGYDPPGGNVQSALSGRIVTVVAVAEGNVFVANPGDSTWTSPTNNASNSPPLNVSGLMQSAPNQQKLWFADGLTDRVYYDPAINTVEDWVLSDGIMPEDSDGNGPRIIFLWRGRTGQTGLIGDPQNIFFSAVDAPLDYDYSPANPSATDAVALNLSDLGVIGDVVTGAIPSSDDVLVVLCDHTIYKIAGDPLAGGQIDKVCDGIGGAWGQAWCKDPAGNIYFFSNVPGVYVMPPMAGGQPVRISQPIDPLIRDVDTGDSTIRLFWDDLANGFWVFITPSTVATDPDTVTHWFYEVPRADGSGGGWYKVRFADPNHNPLCGVTVDGNEANDRNLVIGSWDGYARNADVEAEDDDGTPIESYVLIGPYLTPNLDEVTLMTMQGVFAESSADVAYEILLGKTAEAALTNEVPQNAPRIGTFSASRGYSKRVNRAAHAIYCKLSSVGRWAMEVIRVTVDTTLSRKRARGKR
jgi:hypothetical protein